MQRPDCLAAWLPGCLAAWWPPGGRLAAAACPKGYQTFRPRKSRSSRCRLGTGLAFANTFDRRAAASGLPSAPPLDCAAPPGLLRRLKKEQTGTISYEEPRSGSALACACRLSSRWHTCFRNFHPAHLLGTTESRIVVTCR